VVLPKNKVLCEGPPAANIMDHVPMLNILPFGVCSSPANPTVVAATAAALGVLTPMPCIPAPWAPGAWTGVRSCLLPQVAGFWDWFPISCNHSAGIKHESRFV
jgi:hypothetical protein